MTDNKALLLLILIVIRVGAKISYPETGDLITKRGAEIIGAGIESELHGNEGTHRSSLKAPAPDKSTKDASHPEKLTHLIPLSSHGA